MKTLKMSMAVLLLFFFSSFSQKELNLKNSKSIHSKGSIYWAGSYYDANTGNNVNIWVNGNNYTVAGAKLNSATTPYSTNVSGTWDIHSLPNDPLIQNFQWIPVGTSYTYTYSGYLTH